MKKIFILCFISILLLNESYSKDFWERVNVPNDTEVRDISFAPNGNILSAGYGLFESTDSGISWNDKSFFDIGGNVIRVSAVPVPFTTIYPVNDSIVFFSVGNSGKAMKSSDAGTTLTFMNIGEQIIQSFIKTESNRIFANEIFNLYYSDDFGITWNRFEEWESNDVENYNFPKVKLSISPDGKLFASNNGVWVIDPETLEGNHYTDGLDSSFISCFAFSNGKVFAGSDSNGIYMSTDDGQSWSNLQNSPKGLPITTLTVSTSGKLFAGLEGGTDYDGLYYGALYTSTDEGVTWQKNTNTEFADFRIYDIEIKDNIIYLASAGIFTSTDDGDSWQKIPANPGYPIVGFIGSDKNENIYTLTLKYLYKSNDNMQSWNKIYRNKNLYNSYRIVFSDDDKLFHITSDAKLIFSDDEGETFNEISLPSSVLYVKKIMKSTNGFIYITITDKQYEEQFYISKNNGSSWELMNYENHLGFFGVGKNNKILSLDYKDSLLISEDYGVTWISKPCSLLKDDSYVGLSCVEMTGDYIFLGSYREGIIKSSDGGDTWAYTNFGLNSDLNVNKRFRVYDIKEIAGTVYASTDVGLFSSMIADTIWKLEESGMINSNTLSVNYLNDKHIYAITATGVYRSTDEITSVEDEVIELKGNNFSISPNPTTHFIEININNGASSIATDKVQIFNMLGIEVLNVGTGLDLSSQRIDISTLPAGVYYVMIGDKVEKFVKM